MPPNSQTPNFERIEQALNSKYYSWSVYAYQTGQSVEQFLSQNLDEPVGIGSAYINGIKTTFATTLEPPCLLEYYQNKVIRSPLSNPVDWQAARHILYSANGLVVAFKPAGLHTYPAKEQQDRSLLQSLTAYFNTEIHIPSRLDYSTSGLVLASYTSQSHDYVQRLYQDRWIEKTYLFATHVKPSWNTLRCSMALAADPRHPVLRQAVSVGGQTAITDFKFSGQTSSGLYLIEAHPFTGRTHQIRVHAASLDIPIAGDNFYNGKECNALHLTAYRLRFPNILNRDMLDFSLPEDLQPTWLKGNLERQLV